MVLGTTFALARRPDRPRRETPLAGGSALAAGHPFLRWGHGSTLGVRPGWTGALPSPDRRFLGRLHRHDPAQLSLRLPTGSRPALDHRPDPGGDSPAARHPPRAYPDQGGLTADTRHRRRRNDAGVPLRPERFRRRRGDALRHHHPRHILFSPLRPGHVPHPRPGPCRASPQRGRGRGRGRADRHTGPPTGKGHRETAGAVPATARLSPRCGIGGRGSGPGLGGPLGGLPRLGDPGLLNCRLRVSGTTLLS